jgi:hypothetical protein
VADESGASSAPRPDAGPETFGQTVQRYATIHTAPGACASSRGEVFTIPLEDGKFASIPHPMSPQTWELFMETLKLWQPRLVAADQQKDAQGVTGSWSRGHRDRASAEGNGQKRRVFRMAVSYNPATKGWR